VAAVSEAPAHCCLLLADFTVDSLAGLLDNDPSAPRLTCTAGPFDSVRPALLDETFDCWRPMPDLTVVWTLPERVSETFSRASQFEQVDHAEVMAEVDAFAQTLKKASGRSRFWLVPSWSLPPDERGYGLIDARAGLGLSDLMARMNLRLSAALADAGHIFVLNTNRWISQAGRFARNPKLWYMGKVAFNNDVFAAAAGEIKAAAQSLLVGPRKLVIVDLDDTLWGGVVGEVGRDGIRLGGHDPIGEAFVDFQRRLKALTRRGVLLGIVSKNEEAAALEALREHPEVVLRPKDFAGWRINWQDKAQNVHELVQELNLGLQSAVFIDNSAAERGRVSAALPDVLVPEWPSDPMLYTSTLKSLACFDTAAVTAEDAARTGQYVAERARQASKREVASVEDWLRSLELRVTVSHLTPGNRERTAQLLNKTNQMNLSTRRLSAEELDSWLATQGNDLRTVRVQDKFGDAGLTGIVSVTVDGDACRLVDFVLSCRVFGRKVEETLVYLAVSMAADGGATYLEARLIPTAKNNPCRAFFKRSGLETAGDGVYRWPLDRAYPLPDCITLDAGSGNGRR
jgi:FkbH-like protein